MRKIQTQYVESSDEILFDSLLGEADSTGISEEEEFLAENNDFCQQIGISNIEKFHTIISRTAVLKNRSLFTEGKEFKKLRP